MFDFSANAAAPPLEWLGEGQCVAAYSMPVGQIGCTSLFGRCQSPGDSTEIDICPLGAKTADAAAINVCLISRSNSCLQARVEGSCAMLCVSQSRLRQQIVKGTEGSLLTAEIRSVFPTTSSTDFVAFPTSPTDFAHVLPVFLVPRPIYLVSLRCVSIFRFEMEFSIDSCA